MGARINGYDGGDAAARRDAHQLVVCVAPADPRAFGERAGMRIEVAAPREKRFRDGQRAGVPRIVRMHAAGDVACPNRLPVVHFGLAPLDRNADQRP